MATDMRAAVDQLRQRDPTADSLGVVVSYVQAGQVELEMVVRDHHTNPLGVCHGGVLFTLGDIAMSYLANAGDDTFTATRAGIDFIAPAQWGNTLTAVATVAAHTGATMLIDVAIRHDRTLMAMFRGTVLRIPSP